MVNNQEHVQYDIRTNTKNIDESEEFFDQQYFVGIATFYSTYMYRLKLASFITEWLTPAVCYVGVVHI